MHCAGAAFAAWAVKRGFDLIMLTSDVASLTAGGRRQLGDLKAATTAVEWPSFPRVKPATLRAGAWHRRRDLAARVTMRYRPFGRTGLSVSVVGFGCWPMAGDRANILREVDASLRRLRTDWVDVLLVHWPDAGTPFEETMRGLEEVAASGRARFVGVSNFTGAMLAECMRTRRVDVSQVGYHMLDRRQEQESRGGGRQ